MKSLFVLGILLAGLVQLFDTNLYTMECVPKRHKRYYRNDCIPFVDAKAKEIYDTLPSTDIKDLQKAIRRRRRSIEQSDCFYSINRFIARTLATIENYFN